MAAPDRTDAFPVVGEAEHSLTEAHMRVKGKDQPVRVALLRP